MPRQIWRERRQRRPPSSHTKARAQFNFHACFASHASEFVSISRSVFLFCVVLRSERIAPTWLTETRSKIEQGTFIILLLIYEIYVLIYDANEYSLN